MADAGTTSLAALLSFLSGAFAGNNSHSSGPTSSSTNGTAFQRTAGMAASVGLSLAVLLYAAKTADKNNHTNIDRITSGGAALMTELLSRSEVLYQFVRTILEQVILQVNRGKLGYRNCDGDDDEEDSEEDTMPIIHKGSCHCRSVCFEIIAPRKLTCKEGLPGKIQYRHSKVRARGFRFVRGTQFVNMYYVTKSSHSNTSKSFQPGSTISNNNEEVGAHSFCSRCGVHFLHAPNSHSSALDVNVDCLNRDDIKLQVVPVSNNSSIYLSSGIPVVGQWGELEQENSSLRYPATISEEKSPMVVLPTDTKPPFSGYRHHPLSRNHNDLLDFDTFFDDDDDDDSTKMVLPRGEKLVPGTPSTVYTSQTESLMSSSQSGVPPTLTLDTRDCGNDTESVVSMSSSRSCFPALSSQEVHPSAKTAVSPSTTPLVRHQMQYYMRKHMSSTSSLSSSSRTSPSWRDTLQKTKKLSSFATGDKTPKKPSKYQP